MLRCLSALPPFILAAELLCDDRPGVRAATGLCACRKDRARCVCVCVCVRVCVYVCVCVCVC